MFWPHHGAFATVFFFKDECPTNARGRGRGGGGGGAERAADLSHNSSSFSRLLSQIHHFHLNLTIKGKSPCPIQQIGMNKLMAHHSGA